MKKIMVALDCTPLASDVLLAAKRWVAHFPDAELTLFHALLQPDYYFSGQYAPILGFNEFYNADLTRLMEGGELEEAIVQFMEGLKADLDLPTATLKIIPGNPEDIIVGTIDNLGIELLIIGKHTRGAKPKLGHVAEALLKASAVPVMVVPETNR
ncbi:MAG TPA: universal stress protein [Edaphocola sp.]|nr:universal stress protein [Edaphocola sp.]